ncbi:MAG: Transcription initiation factor TFIID subunit 12 [Peltula sp. TS41687]|nr:MAG: Transcription initiation factor TFIID subunit 12 [Peltula sp. TS41687]
MNNGSLPRAQPALGSQQQQQQQQTQVNNLLRVEQIRNLPHLNDHQKTQYEVGVRALHEALQNHPPESQEYQTAFNKLSEVSTSVRTSYKRWLQMQHHQQQQQQQQQQAGATQVQQRMGPQPQAGQARPPGQPSQPAFTQLSQFPPSIALHVQQFPFTLPPNIVPGSPEGEKWIAEAKIHYAQALNKAEIGKARLMGLTQQVQLREREGKPLTQEEMIEFNQRKTNFTQFNADGRKYIDAFRQQQIQFKTQQAQQRSSESVGGVMQVTQPEAPKLVLSRSQQQPAAAVPGDHGANQSTPQNGPPSQEPSGLNINPVTEGPSQQAGTEVRNVASPSIGAGQTLPGHVATQSPAPAQPDSAQPSTNATPVITAAVAAPVTPANYQQYDNNQQVPNAHPNVGLATNQPRYPTTQLPQGLPPQHQHQPQPAQPPAQQRSPQTNQPTPIGQPERPQSLTHQAALTQAARSYSNGAQNINPTPPTTGGPNTNTINQAPQPTTQDINNHNNKMPIPKNLNIPPPQPVSIASARPTFTGGASNGTNGIMNQPAVPKLPGYLLEGEGERVLSKKKLDELVRQVTGGGEGLGGQLLSPDCEEAILQFADDFIDQVVTAACRVAKLRSSNTLELRDIQLVLERNYNIRIPGYSSDEIRTVKKFAPAPGWTQKMSAVQAAKVTNGKTDQ